MCEYLEINDEEQFIISDFVSKMRGYLLPDGSAPYGNQYLKENLKGHYGDSIYVAEEDGLNDIVTIREKTHLTKSDIKTNVLPVIDQYP